MVSINVSFPNFWAGFSLAPPVACKRDGVWFLPKDSHKSLIVAAAYGVDLSCYKSVQVQQLYGYVKLLFWKTGVREKPSWKKMNSEIIIRVWMMLHKILSVLKLKWTQTTRCFYHWTPLPTGWHFSCMHYATEMIQPEQRERDVVYGCRPRGWKQLLLNLASKDHCSLVSLWFICFVLLFVCFFIRKNMVGRELSKRLFDPISQCLVQCNCQNDINIVSAAGSVCVGCVEIDR